VWQELIVNGGTYSITLGGFSNSVALETDGSGQATSSGTTATELDYIDIVSLGTGAPSKAVVLDASGEYIMPDPSAIVLTDDSFIELDATANGMDEDEANGIIITGKNCGESLSQWDLVEIVNDTDPWHKADATAGSGEYPAFGIAIAACTDTNEAKILVKGIVRNDDWGWTPGAPLYLGDVDDGGDGSLTAGAPDTANDCVQIVGWALTDDEVYFDFSRPYQLVE
jgi:hypothetical protein